MKSLDLDDLSRRHLAGETMEALAESVGMTGNGLRHRFKRAGLAIRNRADSQTNRRMVFDEAAMVLSYLAGETEQAISLRLGISRPVIRRRLLEAGVTPRSYSESQTLRMNAASPETRKALTDAAHAAVRGVTQSEEHRCKVAETRQSRVTNVSANEMVLSVWLRDMGVEVTPQLAVGRYNVDLACTERRVAVEVFGGNWHSSGPHAVRYRKRIDYLADRGWWTVVVWCTGPHPLSFAAAKNVVAFVKARREGEPVGRQEHVIRGDGYVAAVHEVKPYDGAIVISPYSREEGRGDDGRFR